MKTVTITTSQNVKIEYDLASWAERLVAFIIDTVIFAIGLLIISFSLSSFRFVSNITLFLYVCFFTTSIELLNDGQSIGKMLMKIRIVKLNSRHMKMSDYLMRWCFRLFDIWGTSGLLATFLISTTRYNQRLGDVLANTCVIRLSPRHPLKLIDVLSIKTLENYTPVYRNVTRLREQDIVLAKTILEDFQKYRNEAHAEAVDLCTERLMKVMDLTEHQEPTNIDFIKTLIKDFIVLTR